MRRFGWFSSATAAALLLAGPALAGPGGGPGPCMDDDARAEMISAETAAFTEADANGDGALTEEEFANFHALLRKKMNALHFARLDTDEDGKVTQAELAAGRPAGRHGGPPPGGPGF